MPSRADTSSGAGRARAEFALRTLALGALVLSVLFVSGTIGSDGSAGAQSRVVRLTGDVAASRAALARELHVALASDAETVPLHAVVAAVPDAGARALLSAARHAGVAVAYTDSTRGAAIAVEASALVDPKGGVTIRAAAPGGTMLALRDSVGLIDSVRAQSGGATLAIGNVAGSVQAAGAGATAMAPAPAPAIVRRVLVLANAGWEAKFTVAALEERGWNVDVRYALGRNAAVSLGAPQAADTARYAVVVALDSSAGTHVAELRKFAAAGGGVVLAGSAASLREFGDMLPGRAGALEPGVPGALATDEPLDGVSWRPITPDSGAVVLARSSRGRTAAAATTRPATVVARRFGAGSVVQLAYQDVWEWRMSGPEGGVEAHRAWWSSIVSLVAFAPTPTMTGATGVSALPGAAAPYADLVARLGAGVPMPSSRAGMASDRRREGMLLALAVLALLLEWASRRLRGAR